MRASTSRKIAATTPKRAMSPHSMCVSNMSRLSARCRGTLTTRPARSAVGAFGDLALGERRRAAGRRGLLDADGLVDAVRGAADRDLDRGDVDARVVRGERRVDAADLRVEPRVAAAVLVVVLLGEGDRGADGGRRGPLARAVLELDVRGHGD